MNRPPIPQSTLNQIKELHTKGYNGREISERVGVSITTVSVTLKKRDKISPDHFNVDEYMKQTSNV